jgi:hypothetical protein
VEIRACAELVARENYCLVWESDPGCPYTNTIISSRQTAISLSKIFVWKSDFSSILLDITGIIFVVTAMNLVPKFMTNMCETCFKAGRIRFYYVRNELVWHD